MRAIDIFEKANEAINQFEKTLNDYAVDIPKAVFKLIEDPKNYDPTAAPQEIETAVKIAKEQMSLHSYECNLTKVYWLSCYICDKWCNLHTRANGPIANVHQLLKPNKSKELHELFVLADTLYQLVVKCDNTIEEIDIEGFPKRHGIESNLHNKKPFNIDYSDTCYEIKTPVFFPDVKTKIGEYTGTI